MRGEKNPTHGHAHTYTSPSHTHSGDADREATAAEYVKVHLAIYVRHELFEESLMDYCYPLRNNQF